MPVNPEKSRRLYDRDFFGWTQETAARIRQGRFADIDVEALAEEIDDLGRGEQRRLSRHFELYLMHRLKWEYQPGMRSKSWTRTIDEQHRQATKLLASNPSLKPHARELFEEAYVSARINALNETGLDDAWIPTESPFTFEACFPQFHRPLSEFPAPDRPA